MKLIILRVPKKTTTNQVKNEVNEKLSQKFTLPFIGKKPLLRSVQILEHTDPQGVKEYYAVLDLDSEETGKWLVKKCKAFTVCGKGCRFREYFDRKVSTKVETEQDRRAGAVVTEKNEKGVQIEGLESFRRKL